MADKAVNLANFKLGLDTRRDVLSSLPGALETLRNGFINAGGEVEKRRSFVRDAVSFTSGTFGLQDTDSGLLTFGSAAAPASLPTGVSYQRLRPTIPQGTFIYFPSSEISMTELVYSCNFKGKAFVIATYTDSNSYWFYDGSPILQASNGIVRYYSPGSGQDNSSLSSDLAALIDAISGWNGTANVDNAGTTLDGSTNVKSPQGTYFDATTEENAVSGTLTTYNAGQDSSGTTQTAAKAFFSVVFAAGATYTVKAPANKDGTGQVTLASAIAADTNNAMTAVAIKNAINATTPLYGYTAEIGANTDQVFVYAPTDWGVTPNSWSGSGTQALDVTTTGGGGSGSGNTGDTSAFAVSVSPTLVFGVEDVGFQGPINVISTPASVSVVGGKSPFKYTWSEHSLGSGSGMKIDSPNNLSTTFSKFLGRNQRSVGTFKCTVEDSSSPVQTLVTKAVTVTLRTSTPG